ncbi:uncharacterized protein NEMAJ01_0174 [Nematocida major]|uniref:uncharacterized protein n=1 Tax=Nematocida major TaxID=1912982 RepID=UPI002008A367|nr:uncharacterized protein NEMAJ01_0174 [Nematocida major]KAH9385278.1 hypothetical protein NEMAJ01_0174 [Nematocida major]
MKNEETWESVQTKTFIKWINSKLETGEERYRQEAINVPFVFDRISHLRELRDGLTLHSLLYSITGSILKFNTKPVLRVHKRENIEKVIDYLKSSKVEMINIGSADIEEGSTKLTLALIWRFILFFTFQMVREGSDLKPYSSVQKKVLKWCQMKTAPYPGISVKNFESSWKDGKAISALVHSDIGGFVYDEGTPHELASRALGLAHEHLKVPVLITAEDLVEGRCDEKSLLTYLLEYYAASVKNDGEVKRILTAKAVHHASQSIEYADKKIGELSSFLAKEVPDLEKKKKELDAVYNRVRLAEKDAVCAIVSYIIQRDILNRIKSPYTPVAASLPKSFKALQVVGVFDAVSVQDTLRGWGITEGTIGESEYQQAFANMLNELLELSACVTLTASLEILKHIQATLEEVVLSKKPSEDGMLSFSGMEASRCMRERLFWGLQEVKDGVRRFMDIFSDGLARERASISKPISLEMHAFPIPGPHKREWSLLGGQDMYLRIVADGMAAAGTKEFTSIAPDLDK